MLGGCALAHAPEDGGSLDGGSLDGGSLDGGSLDVSTDGAPACVSSLCDMRDDSCRDFSCTQAGRCEPRFEPDGAWCAFGGECVAAGYCMSGVCIQEALAEGTGCEADGSRCTVDLCNGTGSCVMASSLQGALSAILVEAEMVVLRPASDGASVSGQICTSLGTCANFDVDLAAGGTAAVDLSELGLELDGNSCGELALYPSGAPTTQCDYVRWDDGTVCPGTLTGDANPAWRTTSVSTAPPALAAYPQRVGLANCPEAWLYAPETSRLELAPVADTLIADGEPDSNMGSLAYLTSAQDRAGVRTRALVRFDVSSIPAAAQIVDARVRWSVVVPTGANMSDAVFSLHRTLVPWSEGAGTGGDAAEGDATWNHARHLIEPWTAPGGSFGADFGPAEAAQLIAGDGTYEWVGTLIATTRDWRAAPTSNFGLALVSAAEDVASRAQWQS
jgi:hypothetical protein